MGQTLRRNPDDSQLSRLLSSSAWFPFCAQFHPHVILLASKGKMKLTTRGMGKWISCTVWSVVFFLCFVTHGFAYDYDVVVYGSSPAGIAAATAAGQLGMRVALFEPLKMIGGMGAAGNLALHDGSGRNPRTGLALRFTELNAQYYNVSHPVDQPESFVAVQSFEKMLQDANVLRVSLDCRLLSAQSGMKMRGETQSTTTFVKNIRVSCEPNPISAKVFIDSSYDGEIMVAVGDVDYTHGREAVSKYNESLAGARVPSNVGAGRHWTTEINGLRQDGTILKYVQNISELAPPGEADESLMAFQHRLCISGDRDRIPWKRPKGYNREDFLLFERYIAANNGTFDGFSWPPQNLHSFGYPGPKQKFTLCCGVSIVASDQPNLNRGWATATWERKQEIIADHTYFELGMFYFLANDLKVPEKVRQDFNRYGLCSDEFVEYDYIPPQLYIRESNRLVGDFVLTQNNIAKPPFQADSIAVGHWWLDEHMTGKYAVPKSEGNPHFVVTLEGNFVSNATTQLPPYDVPYRLMIPKKGTGANLLVPVCLSASHVAFASTRIETMLMGVGSAAGVAAQQLVDGTAQTVQEVNISMVQNILVNIFKQQIHV